MEGATIRSAAFYGCRLAGCPCGKAAPSKVGRRAGGPPAKPPRPPQLPQARPFPATRGATPGRLLEALCRVRKAVMPLTKRDEKKGEVAEVLRLRRKRVCLKSAFFFGCRSL